MNNRNIGGYIIQDRLGAGAFGEVFKASKNGETYAVKKVDIGRHENMNRLRKEVDSHVRLQHQNIVKYISSLNDTDSLFIVMEYCSSGNLNSYILNRSILDESYLLDFSKQIVAGIEYLHSRDVVHRDIKPDNIMLCTSWTGSITLKLADFGLARVWEHFNYSSPYYTFDYDPRGPPYYSAPEVSSGNITIKSDIFSLGCLIIAIFARTTVSWIGGNLLLAPFLNGGRLQVADATDNQKRNLIAEFVKLPCGGDEVAFQRLVFTLVKENWRDRPNARQAFDKFTAISAGWSCHIL